MSNTTLFITGGTGYIGGTVVDRLLDHPDVSTFEITLLVRTLEKAEKLQTLGLKTVVGDNSNLELLTSSAASADVVISMADSDNYPAARAILDGIKQRFEATGVPPILIHTVSSTVRNYTHHFALTLAAIS
ncbi:hypothetical protein CC2G_007688 [Coprinopsis cinerea AmutBmut pab1-1]|nr:hypothetical protein CC2G_007688 [Coprinopsis cinerea AmutBmut pab1-1]